MKVSSTGDLCNYNISANKMNTIIMQGSKNMEHCTFLCINSSGTLVGLNLLQQKASSAITAIMVIYSINYG